MRQDGFFGGGLEGRRGSSANSLPTKESLKNQPESMFRSTLWKAV